VVLPKAAPEDSEGLHNVFSLSDMIVSGSEPHGEEAFRALAEKGVRIVVSVDGKAPEVELAKRFGLRYVHIPIQYKTITGEEIVHLAKTFRELEGPFYVHCFHGQHRGPAAAAIGRLILDAAPREQAIAEMRQYCGTSSKYEGLYRVIADGEIPDEERTSAYDWDFPSQHAFQGFRQSMIDISRAHDNLKYLSTRDWMPDEEHPDADAMNEANKLVSTFAISAELEEVQHQTEQFRRWMADASQAAVGLRDALRAFRTADGPREPVDDGFASLKQSCTDCHRAYRN
jgi:protein tyrosine phosphatase (PTP) superfamily phosphohydrolase (DUF442 family)